MRFVLDLEGGEREPLTERGEDEREIGSLMRFESVSCEGEREKACVVR